MCEALCSIGGMALTGENQITQRNTCPNASLPTTNFTWTVPEHNPVLHGQKPATNLLSDARPPPWLPFRWPKTVCLSGYSWSIRFTFFCDAVQNQETAP